MKKVFFLFLIITTWSLSLFAGCGDVFKQREEETIKRVSTFIPDFLLTGDLEESVKINLPNDCLPDVNSKHYSLEQVLSFASPLGETKELMIFSRSNKGLSINAESIPHYYLSVNSRGVVFLDSDIELHKQIGSLPLASISEILVICSEANQSGVSIVDEEKEYKLPLKQMIESYGLYVKVKDATFSDVTAPLTLTIYNKKTESASVLTGGKKACVATLEDDTKVLITDQSNFNVHWSAGRLFFIEFAWPIKTIDYREASLTSDGLVEE